MKTDKKEISTENEKKRTTVYLTEDQEWKLRQKGSALRIKSLTGAVEAAIEAWIADEGMNATLSAEQQSKIKKVQRMEMAKR